MKKRLNPVGYLTILAILFVAGCATMGGGTPATVVLTRNLDDSTSDCNVTLGAYNHMRTAWNGIAIHVILRDAGNTAIGEIQGSPQRYTETGHGILFKKTVTGVRCEDIAKISVIWFGYYPADGGGQRRFPNSSVETKLN